MTDEATALIASLDRHGANFLLGYLAAVMDEGRDFTAEDLVSAVAEYRLTVTGAPVPRPRSSISEATASTSGAS